MLKCNRKNIFACLSYITYKNKEWSYETAKHDPGPNVLYFKMANLASKEYDTEQACLKKSASLQITNH
jgi:hypothetical protein